jgi:YD repeat-containing protein
VLDRLTSTAACASHSYDAAGNLVSRSCGSVTWAYTYDALDRLTHVTNTSGLAAAYTYDVLGARIAKRVGTDTTRLRGGMRQPDETAG